MRYYQTGGDGSRTYVSRIVGNVEDLPNKSMAQKAAEAIRMEANADPGRVVVTLAGLIERYKLDKLPERYSTRVSYLSCLNVHIKPKWGDSTLNEIAASPFIVEKWFESLDMAPKTKGHIKALMHRLYECAMKWGFYPVGRNPMELVEIKDVTKRVRRPQVLTYDQFWKVLEFIEQPYRTMVLVAQCLGLRISEVMALQWADFDFENMMVHVQRGIVHGRIHETKTEYSDDDLPLDSDFAEILLSWRNNCPTTPEGWVFPNPSTQRPYWQESICADHIKPAGIKAGLGCHIGWHTFRHTYRTWLDGTGAPVSMQRELMHHASIQTTMDTYGRGTMSDAKRQANSKVVQFALRPFLGGQAVKAALPEAR
jgi:integrase